MVETLQLLYQRGSLVTCCMYPDQLGRGLLLELKIHAVCNNKSKDISGAESVVDARLAIDVNAVFIHLGNCLHNMVRIPPHNHEGWLPICVAS